MNAQIAMMLKNFDLNNLNEFWKKEYNHFSRQSSKENSLQILINAVEGDYSQLSPKLAEIAELQDSLKETTKNIKKFIKEVFVMENFDANYRNEIIKIINRAYLYKVQVLSLNYPRKFLDKTIKISNKNKYIHIACTVVSYV